MSERREVVPVVRYCLNLHLSKTQKPICNSRHESEDQEGDTHLLRSFVDLVPSNLPLLLCQSQSWFNQWQQSCWLLEMERGCKGVIYAREMQSAASITLVRSCSQGWGQGAKRDRREREFSMFSEQIQHSFSQGEEHYLALAHFNHSVLQVFFLILQPLESCDYARLPSFTEV